MAREESASPLPAMRRLGRWEQGAWSLSLYPDAAEAGGCFVPARRRSSARVPGEPAADPDRAALEAGRRARAKVRRYFAANRLNRLGTLTYGGEGCHDPRRVRADVAVFFRALRSMLGDAPLPYLWVPEWHKGGHGLHLHFAVGRFVRRALIDAAWGRGFISIKLLGDLPVGSTSLHEARLAARYLSKYVAKDLSAAGGLHRYEVAQGFQPRKETIRGRSADDVLAVASDRMGSAPERVWRSSDEPDWQGPPAVWASWAA